MRGAAGRSLCAGGRRVGGGHHPRGVECGVLPGARRDVAPARPIERERRGCGAVSARALERARPAAVEDLAEVQ